MKGHPAPLPLSQDVKVAEAGLSKIDSGNKSQVRVQRAARVFAQTWKRAKVRLKWTVLQQQSLQLACTWRRVEWIEAAGGERDFLLVLTKGVTLGRGLPDEGYLLEDVSFEHYSVACYASSASGFCGVGRVFGGLRGTLFGRMACEGSIWTNLPCLGFPLEKDKPHFSGSVQNGVPSFPGCPSLGNTMRRKT